MHHVSPPLLTVCALLVGFTGCAVKPPMRYVAPDGGLHEAYSGALPRREALPRPGGEPQPPPRQVVTTPAAPAPVQPADEIQAHFTTALGLQASCRWGEALATYRGVVEADPDGPLAARALVRMAEIHLEAGYAARDPERARALLHEVVARYPDTAAAAVAGEILSDPGWQ